MKLAVISAAVLCLAVTTRAQAQAGANPATAARNTGTPSGSPLLPNGQSADAVQAAKRPMKATASKPSMSKAAARKSPPVKDVATASAPHRYPATARKATSTTVGAIRSDNDGTVHKNAPVDQVAGAGG
ncbi:MAG: hypothetical protein ABIO39_08420 [Caulobacteraceae bacterium]